jgi:hypothetical protein
MKKYFIFKIYLFSSILSLVLINHIVLAEEWRCESEVYYTWERGKEDKLKTFFRTATGLGSTEDLAKNSLTANAIYVKKKALESCEASHQNLANCLISKSRNISNNYSLRKSISDSIKEDCNKQSGKCLLAETADPKCRLLSAPADVAASPVAAEDEKKK